MPAGTREVPEDVPPPPRRHHRFAASRGRSRGRDNSRATAVSLEAAGRIEAHPPTRTAMSVPPSQARPDARPHLPVLDGIRGCAILLVMATHLAVGVVPANRFDAIVLGSLQGGWIGVDLFFVLSGFLITGILLDSRGGPRDYVAFFARPARMGGADAQHAMAPRVSHQRARRHRRLGSRRIPDRASLVAGRRGAVLPDLALPRFGDRRAPPSRLAGTAPALPSDGARPRIGRRTLRRCGSRPHAIARGFPRGWCAARAALPGRRPGAAARLAPPRRSRGGGDP